MIPERLSGFLDADRTPHQISQRFIEAGFCLYLVGGSVRDLLLGRDHSDLDFATDARPDEILEVVAGWADSTFTVGEAFGTVGVVKRGVTHEITTFRREVYRDQSRKPRVEFSDDLETDLSRRDFTVNAIALKLLPHPEIIDPYGGLADLHQGILRTPLGPEISFSDDPLRMLRLFRFMATLGFEASETALRAVTRMHGRMEIVSAERIRDELSRLLVALKPGAALGAMVASGLAGEFLPEVAALAAARDPLQRHKDVLAHTLAVVDKCRPKLELRLAALLHDVGKPETREFGDGGVTFHHHEVVGARMARDRLQELRFKKSEIENVSRLIFLHLRPHTFKMGWTDAAVRRYVRDAGPLLEDLNELVRCDITTRNAARARAIQNRIDELEERIAELRKQEELDALRPPIDGNDVMRFLGIPPGPTVGAVLRMLTEYRIEHGPYSKEEAYRLVQEWSVGSRPTQD
ncbi:CCA-adding enzyme [bacterium BMS3Abin02]|nr:CCA-adding enzyme [bacterium BMS3Abin02]